MIAPIHSVPRLLTLTAVAGALIASTASAQTTFGVTDNQRLVSFDAANPGAILTGVAVSGLQQNEQVTGIDFRPATGELFALGSFSNLYTIDPSNGAATRVGPGQFSPGLNGSSFGFDFNPTIDRIRVVSDANQNLVLNPNDGGSTGVTPLFYATGDVNEGMDPNVVGSAYTNSFAGSTSTQLYVLVTQANSAGTLNTVGSLGVDLQDVVGFDIDGTNNVAYASVVESTLSRSTFWQIDLATGAATMVDEIGGGALVTSIAVVPAPGAVWLLGGGALAGAIRRRR